MYKIYVVSLGDSINKISSKFGITSEELRRINGFDNAYEVESGQSIVVPAQQNNLFNSYTIKSGDTLYSLANKYNVNYSDLASLNGLDTTDYLHPGQNILVPAEKTVFYITKENDTLSNAANKMQVMPEQLLLENATIYLFPDQLLVHKKD